MANNEDRKLLLPKTVLGWFAAIYFCVIWWLLNTQPCLQFFDNMAKEGNMVWMFGMPVNFAYIILVALATVILTFVVLMKWEVGDE